MTTKTIFKIIILTSTLSLALLSCSQSEVTTSKPPISGSFTYADKRLSTYLEAIDSGEPIWSDASTGQTVSYSLSLTEGGAIASGISIDPSIGVISVASNTAPQAASHYTVTATGSGDWGGVITTRISIHVMTFPEAFSNTYPKVEAGKGGSAFPTAKPDGSVTYSLAPLKAAVGTPSLPTINTNTGEVTVTATTTAGTYQVTATVGGGGSYTARFYVAIIASNRHNITNEIEGASTGIAMWGNNGDYNYLDTSAVTDMSYLFDRESSLEGAPLMGGVRSQLNNFNGDISLWDVSQVTNMKQMFFFADSFTGDLSLWNVSKVTDMSDMFYGASSFNSDISGWTVGNVINMTGVFNLAIRFNADLSLWDVSKVIGMVSMFQGAAAFNQDLNNWDVSNVTDMYSMFKDATAFNGDIRSWDISKVTRMQRMFQNATNFNRDISGWDVDQVTDMKNMFNGATAFNQDLEPWGDHLKGRTVTMTDMFTNSGVTSPPSWYRQ